MSLRRPPPDKPPSTPSQGAQHPAAEAGARGRSAPVSPRLLNIGYGNLVVASRVVAIVSPQSSPMRRLREEAAARGKLVDCTQGRRTRSIVVIDSDHVVLSANNPETIAARLEPDEPSGSGGGA